MTTFRHARSSSIGFAVALCLVILALAASPAQAAAILTATDITWDVIGLDSNNVNVGPNHFPIGTRVCNVGPDPAANLTAEYVWDTPNPLINLRPGTATTLPVTGAITLTTGQCTDFFYEVEVTRDPAAYDTKRGYHIELTADGGVTGSTEVPREVFIEHIISQSRNAVTDMQVRPDGVGPFVSVAAGATMTLLVGEIYEIKLVGTTATNGYEQIETFINFPNIIFQILDVATTYTAESSDTVDPTVPACSPQSTCIYDALYGDGCTWEDDPLNPNYRSCLDVGKAGGGITVTYRVQILTVPSSPLLNPEPLSTLVHDFSGSSYHYNADYGATTRFAGIVDPTTLTFEKKFTPTTTNVNGVSVLTFTITNPYDFPITGVNFTDTFPTSPGNMVVATPASFSTAGCGSPTFLPVAGAGTVAFSDGTLGPNGVCTVSVTVTAPAAGTYDNTSEPLFIGTTSTGLTASASLVVNNAPPPPACTDGMELARWTMAPAQGTTVPPLNSFQASQVSSATASYSGAGTSAIATTLGNPINSWGVTGGWAANAVGPPAYPNGGAAPYFEFTVNTANFTNVSMTYDFKIDGNWAASNNNFLYTYSSADGGPFAQAGTTRTTFDKNDPFANAGAYPAATTGLTTTTFRINAVGQQQPTAILMLDNIVFTGCGTALLPQLTKSFSPDPVAVGATSTLTFTLVNPNNNLALTGATFTDVLPAGLQVAATPNASTTCGGAPTWAPTAGATTLTFGSPTGATIPAGIGLANGTCTAQVDVTATTAGPHPNVSGFISSTQTGPNTSATGTASDTLTAISPPAIAKQFSPNPILEGEKSTLTFTITNPNPSHALSGVAFADTFPVSPGSMVVATPAIFSTSGCGSPTFAPVAAAGSVSFSNGTIVAGGTCTVSVEITAPASGSYLNTSGNVSHIINATTVNGNTATATLLVTAANPQIALLKQVGLTNDPDDVWSTFLSTTAGIGVYYKLTIENTGNVALSPVDVDDPDVVVTGCIWPASLAVGDTAFCVVGPVTAIDGSHDNTAEATGFYGATPVTDSSTATYSTNELTLVKAVDKPWFSVVGEILTYTYGVTNTGSVPLAAPITVTDDKATVTCPPGGIAVGATMVCTATYVITGLDVTASEVTNIATAHAGSLSSNTATKTVPFLGEIDLAISKTDGVLRVETGSTTTYTIVVLNNGPSADGATLSDPAVSGLVKTAIGSCTAAGGATCPTPGPGLGQLNIANLEAGTVVIPTLPNAGSVTIPVTVLVTSLAAPLVPVINEATVTKASGGLTEFNTSNNTDDDPNFVAHNWGHLPSAYANMNLLLQGGAYTLSGSTYLGASKLTDLDGINTTTYTVKPTDDGVTWTPSVAWTVGTGGSVDVTATCPGAPTNPCYLNAWIDFNADNLLGPGEQIFNNTALIVNGTHTYTLTFPIPGDALLDGTTLYSRFRLTDQAMTSPQPNGAAMNGTTPLIGEIEDPFFQVNNGVTTPVSVSSFEARRDGRTVYFDWTTATESGNVGFDIYVQQGKRLVALNEELIPSQTTDSLERKRYSFSAEVEGDTFFIEDVSITGQARQHGPFKVDEAYGGEVEDEKVAWSAIAQEHATQQASARAASLRSMSARPGVQNVHLKVTKSGIQRVTYEALQAAGINPNTSVDRFLLTYRGVVVPIYSQVKSFVPGAYFEFHGEALDTTYTDTNYYQLQIGNRASPSILEANATPSAVPAPPTAYTETFVLNRQRSYANYAPGDDAWYDTSMLVYTAMQNWAIPFHLDAVADPSAAASAELVAWGLTNWPQSPDHHLVASLNGVELVDETFDGLVEKRWTVDLPAGTLRSGANTLDLTLPGDTGVSWDMVNFDQLRISYQRRFEARDGRLSFTGQAQDFQVANLPSKGVVVYRLDGQGLRRLRDVRVDWNGSSFTATFAGGRRAATYFVSTAEAIHAPGIEPARTPADLVVDAEYLVISHPDFIDGLRPLIEAREAQGLTVNVVDVTDIYAGYSYGVFDPQAIRDYIAYAAAELGTQAVLLVGGDTYDYRNYLGGGSISFIPSLYASTGEYARFVPSDTLYVDLATTGVPSLAIGRFPVRTNAELDTIVAKTLAYEQKSYGRTAFFAADRSDNGVSFKGLNAGFVQGLPAGWLSDSVNLDDTDVATAQTRLLAAMNRGTAMVTFTGHSGPSEWTFSHLFTNAHAAALTNAGQPFVVVQWGCWNTYFVDPVNNHLVQSFLFSGDRGAAAVLGATTLTESSSEQMLGALLTPRLAIPGTTIGQALLDAKRELAATNPELDDVLVGWSLMGDPALVIEPQD